MEASEENIIAPPAAPAHDSLRLLVVGALGIVFGDIGTSPLYAFRECFLGGHGVSATAENVLGILSLVLWSLILTVSVKYLIFVLRADNRGEGGILALMTLVAGETTGTSRTRLALVTLGLFGAAMLYGDGMITPAISVLSAVEGLNVATTFFAPYVVPISLTVLAVLFLCQRWGTSRVGAVFGPVMLLWFAVLAVLGVVGIVRRPDVLVAISPWYAIQFFLHQGWHGYLVLGSVFLAVTGAEALYADMGHFGRHPIRLAWFSIAFPALILNYFGQGAQLLASPDTVENLFFRLVPAWLLYPVVGLATVATVIASQAVVSGAFSLTRQAVQLRFLPRMTIVHTSESTIGQVYVPAANWVLLIGTVALVIGFKESGRLAGAYGIAVSTTMLITTVLICIAARQLWALRLWVVLLIGVPLLLIDLAFFGSNLIKVPAGGWVSLLVAGAIYTLMTVWRQGRDLREKDAVAIELPADNFARDIIEHKPLRVPGTAIFLASNSAHIPRALLHNFKHNQVFHEHTILLTVRTEEIPRVPEEQRFEFASLGEGFYRVFVRYGFSEDPNIAAVVHRIKIDGVPIDPLATTFFMGKETLLTSGRSKMWRWRKELFALMSRNALDPTRYFRIPPNRVIELGQQVEL